MCERCRLNWPWALYVFRLDEAGPIRVENLTVLCGACSLDRAGPFAALVGERTFRAIRLTANNRRAAVEPLTPGRRRKLIAARGGACEACGIPGTERALQVHHKLAVLRGGDDGLDNLMVLCFVCHHHLQPCASGCGGWAKKPRTLCRKCVTRRSLEELLPDLSWDEIQARYWRSQ
ncbi:MAG TPA: HNH endonuclease signature motif containing protein [Candidatus Dormibacteraeota bacterium]|nr:HNH endonuclease signature motif containing protein [Candidatus Dormibacteraeota bacterium]